MILNNIKANQKDRGFTIVELLVVIVVIAILAAITIVSYTGITARANASKTVANAQAVVSVAESIQADTDAKYPVTTGEFGTLASTSRIPSGTTIQVTAPTATNGTNTFQLYTLTTGPSTGGKVVFWDYNKTSLCSGGTDSCLYWGAAKTGSAVTVFGS